MNSLFLELQSNVLLIKSFKILYMFMPLWLPILLATIFFQVWMRYIYLKFIKNEGSVLLEIKLPREITKSPLAMEIVLSALHQAGKNSYIETFVKGKARPWFSLELVSLGGQVKFFIWTRPKFRKIVETQIYGQYPGVEIHEVEDYTKEVHHFNDLKPSDPAPFWATYFKLTKDDVYPIKTYVDYGLDKDPKEEFKIDPMTSVLEFLGSMKMGEQVWIQIILQAHRKEGWIDVRLFEKPDWTDAGKKEIEKLISKLKGKSEEDGARFRQATKGESEVITALERSMSKFPFEVCIRGFYIANPEAFNPVGITGLIGSFKQYSSQNLNGFKLGKFTDFDYPWQDFGRHRRNELEHHMLDAYKRRSFFYPPYKHYRQKPFILNTEELATIYHFPGSVATTPSIQKTMSKKGEAPPNLPV